MYHTRVRQLRNDARLVIRRINEELAAEANSPSTPQIPEWRAREIILARYAVATDGFVDAIERVWASCREVLESNDAYGPQHKLASKIMTALSQEPKKEESKQAN